MNKKVYILIALIFTVLIGIAGALVTNNQPERKLGTSIAIMVFDSEINDYVKSDSIPVGTYSLNEDKSICVAGGSVSDYDSTNGTVKYSFNTSDECYLYFDLKIEKIEALLTLASNSLMGNYSDKFNRLSTTYEYTGDGSLSCNSSSSNTSCRIDNQSKTIIIERETCIAYKDKITVTASEGAGYLPTSTILDINWNCLDSETLIDIYDRKKKKRLKKKIKDIKEDDIVYSYDYKLGKTITRKVKKVHINKSREIYHLILENDEIKITGDHPVCVDGAGYLNVSQLKVGYKLLAQDGSSYEIKDIQVEILDQEQDMYSLELDNGSSLSIGEKGIICLAMFVGVSTVMMKSASAIVDIDYCNDSYW